MFEVLYCVQFSRPVPGRTRLPDGGRGLGIMLTFYYNFYQLKTVRTGTSIAWSHERAVALQVHFHLLQRAFTSPTQLYNNQSAKEVNAYH